MFKDAESKEDEGHPSTSLTMTSECGDRLSWACAAGAAAAAEAWCVRPRATSGASPGCTRGSEQQGGYSPPRGAPRVTRRTSSRPSSRRRASAARANPERRRNRRGATRARIGRRERGAGLGTNEGVGVLAVDGLVEGALDALGSSANDATDPELAGRAAFGVGAFGALRLAAATRGAAENTTMMKLAGRTVRQLTLAASISIQANAGDGDGGDTTEPSRAVAAAELPSQRALVVALELQEAAVEASGTTARMRTTRLESGAGAIAAVEATAALVRALPPGAEVPRAMPSPRGLLAKRTLGSILRIAAERLTAAVKPPPDGGDDAATRGDSLTSPRATSSSTGRLRNTPDLSCRR